MPASTATRAVTSRRQDALAVGRRLAVEDVPTGHGDHANASALARQLLAGGQGELNLGACADQDDLRADRRRIARGCSRPGAGRRRRRPCVRSSSRHVLAGQDQGGGPGRIEHGGPPGLHGLRRVGRADDAEAGHAAQGHELLHRLVGGAVLAHADAVVGEDEDGVQVAHGGQADWRPHVVGKGEEGGGVRDQPAVQGHAVGDGAHGVLADAEVEVAAGVVPAAAHGALRVGWAQCQAPPGRRGP